NNLRRDLTLSNNFVLLSDGKPSINFATPSIFLSWSFGNAPFARRTLRLKLWTLVNPSGVGVSASSLVVPLSSFVPSSATLLDLLLSSSFEALGKQKLNVAEVTQSEIGQKQKLHTVLQAVKHILKPQQWNIKWSVDLIHGKNLIAILHLLVALAIHFRAPIRLPEHVTVQLLVVQKRRGALQTRQVQEKITTTSESMIGRYERDAFDTLFDHAPDKLNVVKKSLITFVNKHLNKLNLEVTELETQFADGVYLVLLMGLLEDYFVPLYNFYLTPESFEQKVHNMAFAFELMQDGGLSKPKARPEDVVNHDLKSTLRVLYNLFTKYKHLD
uniref:Parvin, alpha a n=1 Tax=Eptatretus burgeri TaxID=7764 RepID=A0A8C4QL06_EPTBU